MCHEELWISVTAGWFVVGKVCLSLLKNLWWVGVGKWKTAAPRAAGKCLQTI